MKGSPHSSANKGWEELWLGGFEAFGCYGETSVHNTNLPGGRAIEWMAGEIVEKANANTKWNESLPVDDDEDDRDLLFC